MVVVEQFNSVLGKLEDFENWLNDDDNPFELDEEE